VSYDHTVMRRRLPLLAAATLTVLLASAAPALADMSGQGWYGETTDKVVTNFGFILIGMFPLIALVGSLIYWQLEKRKEERQEAAKARVRDEEWQGGW
jgi:hypothetical protein